MKRSGQAGRTPSDASARAEGFVARLRDGRRVQIRPVKPGDKPRFEEGFERLSSQSRYFRFHQHLQALTPNQLTYLTEVDQVSHVAWVALALDDPGEPGIGVIRYVRDPDDPRVAEIAVTVVDQYQGLSLGRLLTLAALASATANGIDRVMAYVLPDNERALRLFRPLGAVDRGMVDGTVVLEIPVTYGPRPFLSSTRFRGESRDGGAGKRPSSDPAQHDVLARVRARADEPCTCMSPLRQSLRLLPMRANEPRRI